MPLALQSSTFNHGADIPVRYTCQADDVSPPLSWEQVPGATQSLVLIVDDPDAPNPEAPKMTWVHWLLYNIPPSTHALEENISTAQLPPGTREGVNDWNRAGYGGPCPPIGRHRYFFKLYALDCVLDDLHSPTKPTLEAVMQGHIIEQTELVGMFKK